MDINIQTFKDFLQIYNNLSEMCFKNCIVSFNTRSLDEDEEKCVENCSSKFIKLNHRFMAVYSEYQQALLTKRLKEAEEQANQVVVAETPIVNDVQNNSEDVANS